MEEAFGILFGETQTSRTLERRAEGEGSATLSMDTLDGFEESAQDNFVDLTKHKKDCGRNTLGATVAITWTIADDNIAQR